MRGMGTTVTLIFKGHVARSFIGGNVQTFDPIYETFFQSAIIFVMCGRYRPSRGKQMLRRLRR